MKWSFSFVSDILLLSLLISLFKISITSLLPSWLPSFFFLLDFIFKCSLRLIEKWREKHRNISLSPAPSLFLVPFDVSKVESHVLKSLSIVSFTSCFILAGFIVYNSGETYGDASLPSVCMLICTSWWAVRSFQPGNTLIPLGTYSLLPNGVQGVAVAYMGKASTSTKGRVTAQHYMGTELIHTCRNRSDLELHKQNRDLRSFHLEWYELPS